MKEKLIILCSLLILFILNACTKNTHEREKKASIYYLQNPSTMDLYVLSTLRDNLNQTDLDYFLNKDIDLNDFAIDGSSLLFFVSPEGSKDINKKIDIDETRRLLNCLLNRIDIYKKNNNGEVVSEYFRRQLDEALNEGYYNNQMIYNRKAFIAILESIYK